MAQCMASTITQWPSSWPNGLYHGPAASTMAHLPPSWPSYLHHGLVISTMAQLSPPWSSHFHHGPAVSTMVQWPPSTMAQLSPPWSSGLHHDPVASTMVQWPPPWPSCLHHGPDPGFPQLRMYYITASGDVIHPQSGSGYETTLCLHQRIHICMIMSVMLIITSTLCSECA